MKIKIYLIILISLLSTWRLFRPGYFSMQDDTQIFRLQQFDQCLKDGQIPCRFIADGGLGYGYPLYNYYSPLPYFIAEIFHLAGFSFINSIKILFILGHLLAGLSMFLFASRYWGAWGGLLSATLFLFAPYRAIDGYVRGALAEFLAISLLPLIFYFLSQKKTKAGIICISALLLTHNLTSLIALPLIAVYVFVTNKYKIKSLFFLIIPFCLSAFFLIPAVFEKNLVTLPTMTRDYFDYRAHFTTLKQLFFDRSWGFGASLWGPIDDMSFQVGLPLWPLALISLLFIGRQKQKTTKIILALFSFTAIFALFLTHNKSTFIWTSLPFMAYFQFPWRFLLIVIFSLSFISGALFSRSSKKILAIFLILLTIALNLNYFKEDIWFAKLGDQEKLSFTEITRQSGAGLMDYWPDFGSKFPNQFAPSQPFSEQSITINSFSKTSHQAYLDITVNSSSAEVIFPMVYFPAWQVYENKKPLEHRLTPDLGLIEINLSSGNHQLILKLKNTPVRTIANLISLVSLIGFSIYALKTKK